MVTLEQYPIGRSQIIKNCPGKQASPSVVRDWIRTYLSYRGVDPEASSNFLWRGIELYRAEIPELRDAFKRHCELGDWEANIIANDVYTILEKAMPPSERSFFQLYVYHLLGSDSYRKLMLNTQDPTLMDYLVGISAWAKFLVGHLLAVMMACTIFWAVTNHELPARLSRHEI